MHVYLKIFFLYYLFRGEKFVAYSKKQCVAKMLPTDYGTVSCFAEGEVNIVEYLGDKVKVNIHL